MQAVEAGSYQAVMIGRRKRRGVRYAITPARPAGLDASVQTRGRSGLRDRRVTVVQQREHRAASERAVVRTEVNAEALREKTSRGESFFPLFSTSLGFRACGPLS